jgi:hypothetical protein
MVFLGDAIIIATSWVPEPAAMRARMCVRGVGDGPVNISKDIPRKRLTANSDLSPPESRSGLARLR